MPFIELQSVDSTNNYAREQIHAARLLASSRRSGTERQGIPQHGTAFFAREQRAGKGQRGKTWDTEKEANIALSILINPAPLLLADQFRLSACTAVSVHRFFSAYAGSDTKIKWPNDLYWQDRKAGGILIESVVGSSSLSSTPAQTKDSNPNFANASSGNPNFANASSGKWEWAIIGIGININQTLFSPALPNPVSLKQITGKHFDPTALAKELHRLFMEQFSLLTRQRFEEIYTTYTEQLYKRGETVRLKKDNRVFAAQIITVLPNGKLLIRHAIEEEIDFGEVEWIR